MMDIKCFVFGGNLLAHGMPTREAAERYCLDLGDAVETAYPDANVHVSLLMNFSGACPGPKVLSDEPDFDDGPTRRTIESLTDAIWQSWCESLTDEDYDR